MFIGLSESGATPIRPQGVVVELTDVFLAVGLVCGFFVERRGTAGGDEVPLLQYRVMSASGGQCTAYRLSCQRAVRQSQAHHAMRKLAVIPGALQARQ